MDGVVNDAPVNNRFPPPAASYQLYTGDAAADDAVSVVAVPLHTTVLPETALITGDGFTIILNSLDVPQTIELPL